MWLIRTVCMYTHRKCTMVEKVVLAVLRVYILCVGVPRIVFRIVFLRICLSCLYATEPTMAIQPASRPYLTHTLEVL